MSETVALDFELKSPIGKVWHALTDSAMLTKWMFFGENDFKPVVGHKFQFRMEPGPGWSGIVDGEVLEVDEPRRLSYTWVSGPEGSVAHTEVAWTLTESEDGVTRIHLEQSGFDSEAKQAIGGAKYGWTRMLEQMKELLAAQ